MRAIVLAGGEGTRMRPLTRRTPKPLVPLLNRPLLDHLLLHLAAHGFDEITLALTHRAEAIQQSFGRGERLGLALDYAYEDTPLGSGGAIASIAAGWNETFLVCNGDIVTDLDLLGMLSAHRERAAELSISLFEVADPSAFGVADLDEADRIRRFVEKPPREEAPSHYANSGMWLFEPSLLADMDATRFNRVEDELFPTLASAGRPMYGFQHDGFWLDVGNPDAYLRANLDLVTGALPTRLPEGWPADGLATAGASIEAGALVRGPLLLGAGTTIAIGAEAAGPLVTGAGCTIAAGARVRDSVLWEDVTVEAGATVTGSVLADGARVGAGVVVEGAVLGQRAQVAAGDVVPPGTRVAPDTVWSAAEA